MLYLLLKFAHLTAAAFFIGGVFFEVMILSRATQALPDATKAGFSRALGQRARQVMHWVILVLYAAGLGLAWLASALGFGEGFAQFLLLLLAAVAVFAVIGMVRRGRSSAAPAQRSPLAFQGAGAGQPPEPVTARSYSPQNVGNDASARPWERSGSTFGADDPAQGGGLIGSALAGPQTWGIPADFDTEGFLRASKANFVKLQDAWDRADVPALRAMMTDEMVEQIQAQLTEREAQAGSPTAQTEVVMLEAQLLGIEELDHEYMASVEFSGMIREEPSAGPNPFREVWNITRPKQGTGGWLVAGVQALQ